MTFETTPVILGGSFIPGESHAKSEGWRKMHPRVGMQHLTLLQSPWDVYKPVIERKIFFIFAIKAFIMPPRHYFI